MALRSRELSVVEHVTDALDRLAADPFNAVITLDAERALARAAALDAELAAGHWRGPLHGVALGVKDLIDVAGLPTRAGSLVLADAPPAAADAPVVARLVEAGAVVVAKLHTHEFAYGPTGDVAATGPARNPHDPTRITGGSSSGSAASPIALASHDAGAACDARAVRVVGLKPAGRPPRAFPLSETLDHVGRSPPTCIPRPSRGTCSPAPTAPAGASRRRGARGAGRRAGRRLLARRRPVDRRRRGAAVERLRAAVAEAVAVSTPMIDELAATYPVIVGAEAWATHADAFTRVRSCSSRSRSRGATRRPSARAYVDALRTRRRLTAAMRAALTSTCWCCPPPGCGHPIGAETVTVDGVEVPVRPAAGC